ncbi:hypothetical protein ACM14_04125 [Delftia sp. JD2]|nr:hypothetical protein ACM14_04125 [Delftia sp. JD2]
MAESFVNTFKRDYVARMDLSDAQTVLAQPPAAFEHFNEVHPHSSLKMRSPRELRRQQAAGADELIGWGRECGGNINRLAPGKTTHQRHLHQ